MNRIKEIEELAIKNGLNFFPVVFNVVEQSTMFDLCAYGLPVRARHWSYGRSYDHQKAYGEMGFSKVYEIILNSNPAHAFMLNTNSETQNLFIAAHVIGHSHFFKNNYLFKNTDRNMIRTAAYHARRVDQYIERYGFDRVERLMDIGFALDNHIDWFKGLRREKYPEKHVRRRTVKSGEYDDLKVKDTKFRSSVIEEVVNDRIPPHPEKDLLWFMINYAPLEDWEKDVLEIMRNEAFYFYPQMMSKVMNEGFASFWHAELMYQYKKLTAEEHLDFCRDHEKVVQPGANPFNINPYFLGFRIFQDIEKRWNEKYEKGESDITGRQKIFEVARNEDDISFIKNYLTGELIDELKLFAYGYAHDIETLNIGEKINLIELKSRQKSEIIEALVKPLYNGGAPCVAIIGIGPENALLLEHQSENMGTLDFKFAEKTLECIWDLWAAPVELQAKDDDGEPVTLHFDEAGFYIENDKEEG